MRVWQRILGVFLASSVTLAQIEPAAVAGAASVFFVAASFGKDAEARGGGSRGGSGGYSRPSGSSRTPSLSSPSPFGSGSSGGYSKPSRTPDLYGNSQRLDSSRTPNLSARDRDASRAESRRALGDYEGRQNPTQRISPQQAPTQQAGSGSVPLPKTVAPAPAPALAPNYQGPARFGLLEAGMMFMLLNSLNRPANAEFFHHHAQDPDYLAWRSEAEKMAQTDPALKNKLAEVDQAIAQRSNQPRDPSFMPTEEAKTPPPARSSSSSSVLWVILLGGGALWLLYRWRKKLAVVSSQEKTHPIERDNSMTEQTVSSASFRPAFLRLGMRIAIDPSPFILSGPNSPVPPPEKGGGPVSVTEISAIEQPTGGAGVFWLGIGQDRFIDISLSAQGHIETARYFAKIDEVYPADADEWGFWLDLEDGMLGWPEFQTKAGHLYQRHWLAGQQRVPPRALIERRERTDGVSERNLQAMLYSRDTGLTSPAPNTEYLLILAAQTPDEAWVELYLGIDLAPSSLGLS